MPWEDLNKRQQDYLKAVYEGDQARETSIKRAGARGRWNSTPASEWRWMPYNASGASLLRKITDMGYRDHGTGSTFAALERRGLVLCKYEPGSLGSPILLVQITKSGRKMVREALSIPPAKRLPVGMLKEAHWKALVKAYVAGPEGVRSDEGGYGGIWWRTWLRLRDYTVKGQDRALIKEAKFPATIPRRIAEGYYSPYEHRLCITGFGRDYYREHWPRYRDLYPDVEAPAPEEDEQ
ncbi:MAG: hypothetical protein H0U76_04095 [Ktedonobacteraceae bacterium]|nr:hypothetical protein [Ktedonobacteraceae bacterium]